MTRIIPTVIIHLTGKEQLIKKRKEEKGLDVAVVEGRGRLVNRSRIRTLITRISSLFEEAVLKRTGMMKLK